MDMTNLIRTEFAKLAMGLIDSNITDSLQVDNIWKVANFLQELGCLDENEIVLDCLMKPGITKLNQQVKQNVITFNMFATSYLHFRYVYIHVS